MSKTGLLDLASIRDDIAFADVLAHYDLRPEKPSTTQVKIACPFHEDSTPSCSINLEKGIFRCFGCQAKGNVLEFIALSEEYGDNGPYKAALKAVEIMGGDVAAYRKEGQSQRRHKTPKKAITDEAKSKRSRQVKTSAKQASSKKETEPRKSANPAIDVSLKLDHDHPFLAERNVEPEVAEAFGIGFCKTGIMKNRIAVPIHNLAGDLVAYTGRYAEEDPPDNNTPRYKLPKGFEKSLELFNLHRAAEQDKPYVVVVEGIWSTIRLHQAGVPSVALLGTSVSEAQAALLADAGFRYVILILDGDDAGKQATPAAVHVLSQSLYVKILVLPEGIKPDTMDEDLVSRLCR